MKSKARSAAFAAGICVATALLPALAGDYPHSPAALNDVKVTGGFWFSRIETNRLVTVKTDFAKCEETGRISSFEKAGRREKGGFKGVSRDSDVYKVIEGAAYTLAQRPDPELDRYLDGLIAKIASAQEPDGYLYTARTLGHKAHDKVEADKGCLAVERGPLVYCAEGADNGGKALGAALPPDTMFEAGEIEIASTTMVSLKGGGLTLIPYFAWCHRGAGEMQTWFAEREALSR